MGFGSEIPARHLTGSGWLCVCRIDRASAVEHAAQWEAAFLVGMDWLVGNEQSQMQNGLQLGSRYRTCLQPAAPQAVLYIAT